MDTFYEASELEVAAPMPVAQGSMGVEQVEPMTVERNLTSGGETSVEDVEIFPMVRRAQAAGKESKAQAQLRALQKGMKRCRNS